MFWWRNFFLKLPTLPSSRNPTHFNILCDKMTSVYSTLQIHTRVWSVVRWFELQAEPGAFFHRTFLLEILADRQSMLIWTWIYIADKFFFKIWSVCLSLQWRWLRVCVENLLNLHAKFTIEIFIHLWTLDSFSMLNHFSNKNGGDTNNCYFWKFL